MTGFISRLERFGRVESTQRIVRHWLDEGVDEVAVAVADEQTAGRGRLGRSWTAPPGRALLVSLGFRPGIELERSWRIAAVTALATIDAAEAVGGLRDGSLRLKWPNDIVVVDAEGTVRKLAGLLAESVGEGERARTMVVGMGVNADWPASEFPADLAGGMTSLREVAGRPVDRDTLLEALLDRLEPRYLALRGGRFDSAAWSARQVTTGALLEVDLGERRLIGVGAGVDPGSGSLLLDSPEGRIVVASGDVTHCRLVPAGV